MLCHLPPFVVIPNIHLDLCSVHDHSGASVYNPTSRVVHVVTRHQRLRLVAVEYTHISTNIYIHSSLQENTRVKETPVPKTRKIEKAIWIRRDMVWPLTGIVEVSCSLSFEHSEVSIVLTQQLISQIRQGLGLEDHF